MNSSLFKNGRKIVLTPLLVACVIMYWLPIQAKSTGHFKYAIVISNKTDSDKKWGNIAKMLTAKYENTRIFKFNKFTDLVAPLAAFSPDYIAYVAKPQEASSGYIRRASWLNRQLENRPYGLAVWGVVTGYNYDDAMRIASNKTPLHISFGLGAYLGYIDALPEGIAYSEFLESKPSWQEKKLGQSVDKRDDAPDNHMFPMIDMINANKIDGLWTSGHAGEDEWLVYYPESTSRIVAENGGLTGVEEGGASIPIQSGNPKIYLAVGNCLTAKIANRNASYALSWIHSGGVDQFFGYITETYYGMMGWGTADNFFYRGGKFNVAESAFVANQSLLLSMDKRLAPDEIKDMEYDEDSTVVYGDPAWMATVPEATAVPAEQWETNLDRSSAEPRIRWELTVTFKKDSNFSPSEGKDIRPVFVFLPERVKNPQAENSQSENINYHIASNFVIINFHGTVNAGESRKFVFTSDP